MVRPIAEGVTSCWQAVAYSRTMSRGPRFLEQMLLLGQGPSFYLTVPILFFSRPVLPGR